MRDVQRQCCWKSGSGDGQRLSLYDYGTTERSFNAIESRGSTLTWTVCTATDSKERQICTTCLFTESVGLWKTTVLCFLPWWSTFLFQRGWGKRGNTRGSPQWNTKDQLPKPQTATVAIAQRPKWSSTYSNNRGERTASTEQTSKKGIKLMLLEIEKEFVCEAVRGNKHKMRKSANCKSQISTICRVNDTDLCVVICRFSGCVCHLKQLHAQSPFLFPIVFSINCAWGALSMRERERDRDGSDVTIVALKLAICFHFPLQKLSLFVFPFTLPVSPCLNGNQYGSEVRNEFTISVARKFRPPCSDSCWAAWRLNENPRQMIKSCPVLYRSFHWKKESN